MSIKDILVFLDDGDSNSDRVNTSIQLAKSNEAQLTGASLASMKPIHAKSDNDQIIERMSDKLAHTLAQKFIQTTTESGLASSTLVISGDAAESAEKMARYARNADIVILSQPNPSEDNYERLQGLSQQVMLLSGRPVLFMPYIGTKKSRFDKIMIAWDGTPAASRAVHDAIPLMSEASEVIILVVESKKQKEIKTDLQIDRLVNHLSNHKVNAKPLQINPGSNKVASVILNKIYEKEIDLLVIGGYGTPTLKQKIFGNVSATMLSSMTVPVLMSH